MASPGYLGRVSIMGTPAAVTGQALASLGSNRYKAAATGPVPTWIIDPRQTVTVYDNGTPLAADAYVVDYLFATVTLDGAPAGTVTADFTRLPLTVIASMNDINAEVTRSVVKYYTADNVGAMSAFMSTKDFKVSGKCVENAFTSLGAVGTFDSLLASGENVLIQVGLNADQVFRGWAVVSKVGVSTQLENVVETPVEFEGTAIKGNGRDDYAGSKFGDYL